MHLNKLNRVQYTNIFDSLFLIWLCLSIVGCKNDRNGQSLHKENDGTYRLKLSGKEVGDLSKFSEIPLSGLVITNTSIVDLTPLRDLPLRNLGIYNSPIRDLSAISNVPLEYFSIGGTDVQNLSPLQSTPLVSLQIHDPFITNGIYELYLLDTLIAINGFPPWHTMRLRGLTRILSKEDGNLLTILVEEDLDRQVADDPSVFVEEYQGIAKRLMLCNWDALSEDEYRIASAIVNNTGTGFVRLRQPRPGLLFLSFLTEQEPDRAVFHGNLAGALKLSCLVEGENQIVYERALTEYRIALNLGGRDYALRDVLIKNIEFIEIRLKEMAKKNMEIISSP